MRRPVSGLTFAGLMLALLMISALFLAFNVRPARSSTTTIIVPDDYPTIQEAINNANDGDKVFVKSGVYQQLINDPNAPADIVINKSISLIGQNEETTIISGVSSPPPGEPLPSSFHHIIRINADNVTIKGFTIENGYFGCWVLGSGCMISDSKFMNNVEGVSLDAGGGTVSDCFFYSSIDCGIVIFQSSNNTLTSNVVQNGSYGGIYVFNGNGNKIVGNEINDIADLGIILDFYSANNIVAQNDITSNGWDSSEWSSGIVLSLYAESNQIVGNNVSDNKCGLSQNLCSDNSIYHNSFIDNQVQVKNLDSSVNFWDNGYPSGGNYWSDYHGNDSFSGPYQNVTGGDGIGDAPNVMDAVNTDHYPLMNPRKNLAGDVNMDGKVDVKDIAIVARAFGSVPGDPRWNALADLNEDQRIDIRDIVQVAIHFGKS
jgi:nitrous oxidase accessory protein